MTRVISYNILVGGTSRVDQLTKIIRSREPDIVGLVEATDQRVVKELAERLSMQYKLSGYSGHNIWQAAVLSRLPIVGVRIHQRAVFTKQPLLEVNVEEANGRRLVIFVTHLTAAFSKVWIANTDRRREVQELLKIMSPMQSTPHLLMGDFNSLAPGERLQASSLLRYMTEPGLYYRLQPDAAVGPPDLDFVLPAHLRILKPMLEFAPRSKVLCTFLDTLDFLYAPRGGIDLLQEAGYADCFRSVNPYDKGFTWPAPMPSGRVDFIFASPELRRCLLGSDVVKSGEGVLSEEASDHLPVFVEFESA